MMTVAEHDPVAVRRSPQSVVVVAAAGAAGSTVVPYPVPIPSAEVELPGVGVDVGLECFVGWSVPAGIRPAG